MSNSKPLSLPLNDVHSIIVQLQLYLKDLHRNTAMRFSAAIIRANKVLFDETTYQKARTGSYTTKRTEKYFSWSELLSDIRIGSYTC